MGSLPPPTQNQSFCKVSALEAGQIDLPTKLFVVDADPDEVITCPSLAFVLHHSVTNANFVFDLGIRKDTESYPPGVQKSLQTIYTVRIPQDVAESLANGGLAPADVSHVCVSHCHWDHVGDTRPFSAATFLLGTDARTLFTPGYPTDPNSNFAADHFPSERTQFLPSKGWAPIGPFPRALDFYGDGSLYIVDSPGHLHGHVNLLVRSSPDGAWIFLAGDSAHHWSLLKGAGVAAWLDPHRNVLLCAHVDKPRAEEHISRIRALAEIPRVRIIIAHDEPWYNANKGGPAFWPGVIESL